MSARAAQFRTHEVLNQPPPLLPFDAWASDLPLREAVARHAPQGEHALLARYGRLVGDELSEAGFEANRVRPLLHTHDRYGRRIDRVQFSAAYHQLLGAAAAHGVHSHAWREGGSQVVRAALSYLHHQAEAGTSCPLTMSFAAVPVLRAAGAWAQPWLARACSLDYDGADRFGLDKPGITLGMGMTEKQGGSDVRANRTEAHPLGGDAYELVGHKWFFSAPMSDAFLVLAQAPGGISCFLLPRWVAAGERNAWRVLRLKDKLGNWANASSEVEFEGALAWRIGEEGRGIATILDMVALTRLDCLLGSAAEMRRALIEAIHHALHRRAFGARLIEQPLMREVLADLALESEAATALALRIAAAIGAAAQDPQEAAFARIATALGKYWVCKRAPGFVNEAQECLGGAGYVEESILPRLFRESPLNSIWEGCGNIQCLDVLRALQREAGVAEALHAELAPPRGAHPQYARHLERLDALLGEARRDAQQAQRLARRLAEALALALQAAQLLRHAPPAIADAFCRSRLGEEGGRCFGVLPAGAPVDVLLARAWPQAA
jgi:putative acyl-CoA dehydrogenase